MIARNVVANLAGRGWLAMIAITLTPMYVGILGVEAFGLVGAFTALQAIVVVFDLGLGLTLNRELARLRLQPNWTGGARARDTIRTLEAVYWLVGLALTLVIVAGAGFASSNWFHTSALHRGAVTASVALMGIAIGAQWPSSLYFGGLLGLERQVAANAALAAIATIRGVGTLLVLWLISPTVEAFFLTQAFAGVVQTLVLRVRLQRSLPPTGQRSRFRLQILRDHWRFAADLTGISVFAAILTQMDKVVVSSLVSLQAFGYYALAATIAGGLYIFVSPVFSAVFPRLASVSSQSTDQEMARTYHTGAQLLSLLLLPPAIALITFAPEATYAWLGDSADHGSIVWLVRILAAGTTANGLMNMPYALMLATGWTRLPLVLNLSALVTVGPLIVFLTNTLGTLGGALAWLTYNVAYMLIGVPIMHRRLLAGHLRRWYIADVGTPLLVGCLAVITLRAASFEPTTRLTSAGIVLAGVGLAAIGVAAGSDVGRGVAVGFLRKRRAV